MGSTQEKKMPVRKSFSGLAVPNGSITIDGYSKDWKAFGESLEKVKQTSIKPKLRKRSFGVNGSAYGGPNDLSFTLYTAADQDHFYALIRVKDHFLANYAMSTAGSKLPKKIYTGDDIEIFIDANPPEKRFAQKHNKNTSQIMIAPSFSAPGQTEAHKEFFLHRPLPEKPDVEVATRHFAWGYVIEISVPKSLYPHWQANPEMASIGFELEVHDADDFGSLYFGEGNLEAIRWLNHTEPHFKSPRFYSLLNFDVNTQPVESTSTPELKPLKRSFVTLSKPGEAKRVAQALYDRIGLAQQSASALNAAAIHRNPTIKNAAVYILSRNLEVTLEESVAENWIQYLKTPPKNSEGLNRSKSQLGLMLIALGARQMLPTDAIYHYYARAFDTLENDPGLRLNFLFALKLQNDPQIANQIRNLLSDGDYRIRTTAIQLLYHLGDTSFKKTLVQLKKMDPSPRVRTVASETLKKLRKK